METFFLAEEKHAIRVQNFRDKNIFMIFCDRVRADVVSVADGARGYLQYLVVERGLAANTVESYRRDLNRYAEVLAARGKTELGDVTARRRRRVPGRAARPATKIIRRSPPARSAARSSRSAGCTRSPAPRA